MTERFSAREGYRPPAAPITIREDAPPEPRGAVLVLAEEAGMTPDPMRDLICQVLLVRPDPNNWTEYPNIRNEVDWLVMDAPWQPSPGAPTRHLASWMRQGSIAQRTK